MFQELKVSPFTSHSFLRDLQSIDFPSDIILYFVIDPLTQPEYKPKISVLQNMTAKVSDRKFS